MSFSQYLINLAVEKYNLELKENKDPSDFNIRPIPLNIRTNLACEVFTKREDDFLRLRLYLVFSDITQLIPYKVEVDRSDSISDLTDEVYVTTGDINFYYVLLNIGRLMCNVGGGSPPPPPDPIIGFYLLLEKGGYILTEDDKKILIPTINNYADKNFNRIDYYKNSKNILDLCPVAGIYNFTTAMAISASGDRIAVSSPVGFQIGTGIIITDPLPTPDYGDPIPVPLPNSGNCINETTGEILIYKKQQDNSWLKEFTINGFEGNDFFGIDLDMNGAGDILTVSANRSNKFYIYKRSGSTWSLLKIEYNETNELEPQINFSSSIAINFAGNTIITNDPYKVNLNDRGIVNIYNRIDNSLTLTDTISKPNLVENDYGYFGYKVKISKNGNRIIITNKDIDNTGNIPNKLYVYSKIIDTWTLEDIITVSNASSIDGSNDSISISDDGNIIAIGAYKGTVSGTLQAGTVYLFSRDINGSWNEIKIIDNPEIDNVIQFGKTVTLSGDGKSLYIGTLLKFIHMTNNDTYRCYWYVYEYKETNGVWNINLIYHDDARYDVYTSQYFNDNIIINNISNKVQIKTNYDASIIAIGTNKYCYVFS